MTVPLRSCLYEGVLTHRRHGPTRHSFQRRMMYPYLDLAEVADVASIHPFWSVERRNVVSFHREDFLGVPTTPLSVAVRDVVERATDSRPNGRIALLGLVRSWGWLFNPLTLYFCDSPAGGGPAALVLQVTNTPWHEQHHYVVGPPGTHEFDKQLHVSPFMPMDQRYRLNYAEPGRSLSLKLETLGSDGGVIFDASMALRRVDLSRAALGRFIWRYPFQTLRASGGIHTHAARLALKRTPLHRHPEQKVAA